MIKNINFNDFCDGFPESYSNNFTYEGKRALLNYLEEYEDSTGESIEFDPIAFCCEYTEYSDFKELQGDYSDIETMEELENHTTVIMLEGSDGFIIQDY